MATSALDPKEIFLRAVFFDYSSRVLWMDASITLSAMASSLPGATAPLSGSETRATCTVTVNTSADLPPSLFPSIMNGAFALELYLKALIVLESGSLPKKVHDLSDLFQKLLPSTRAQVEKSYNEEFEKASDLVQARNAAPDKSLYALEKMLTKYNDLFVKSRYSHELPHVDFNLLAPIRIALLQTNLAMKNEWVPLAKCLEGPPTYLRPLLLTPTA